MPPTSATDGAGERRLAPPSGLPLGRRLGAWLLVGLMALGSVLMWLVSPVAWLYLVSQTTTSSQPSAAAYLGVLAGIVVTAVVIGKSLAVLDRVHTRLVHPEADMRYRSPWLKSMRDDREARRREGVLETVMVWSVGAALALTGIWFAFFAGSSLIG